MPKVATKSKQTKKKIVKVPAKKIRIGCSSDVWIDLDDLAPFEDNPRELSEAGFAKLKTSLLTIGLFKPLLVWAHDNSVLGGNQRLRVIRFLIENEGYKLIGQDGKPTTKIPVTRLDVEEKIARTIVLRDNQSDGDWVYEQLGEYLQKLEQMGMDIALTGFGEKEYEDLKKLIETPDETRKRLEKLGEGQDLDDMVTKMHGVSFKVPDEDMDFYKDRMGLAKRMTGSDDTWTNIKAMMAEYEPALVDSTDDDDVDADFDGS